MNLELHISQIFIQILAFLVMLWILKRFGWQPLLNLLDERQKKIRAEFDSIAAQKEEVQKLVENYKDKLKEVEENSRHKIQEAIKEGRKIAKEIQEEAQTHAKMIFSKAQLEADKEIVKAKKQLKNDLIHIIIATVEKILQEKLDESTHNKLITEFVEETKLK